MEAQKLREEAAREHSKAEEKVAQLEIQQQNLQELIVALTYVTCECCDMGGWFVWMFFFHSIFTMHQGASMTTAVCAVEFYF